VLLVAEVGDLRANPDRHAEGVVLESRIETGRGAVATLLVKTGTLKQGDTLVIGSTWGRVRAMSDEAGKRIKEAGPSTPVEIFGLEDVPGAGDEFAVVGTEKDARALAEHRAASAREGAQSQRQRLTVDDLFKQGGTAPNSELFHVVIKADVAGSLEALRGALEGIEVSGTTLKVLHAAIGPVNESDVNLAAGNNGMVVAFNTKADAKARGAAESHGVTIQRYDIIYQVIDDIKARLQGLLAPVFEDQRIGEAEVRAVFNISKSGPIAGCMVVGGKVQRGSVGRITREGKVVHEGKLTGLKRFKEDVREVVEGFECGIQVEGYNDIAAGDRIEFLVKVEVPRQ
jgi:translation initiation factor IF-2